MSKWDDWIQSEENSEMLIYEEWVRYADLVLYELAREKYHPKDQDGHRGDSQRQSS